MKTFKVGEPIRFGVYDKGGFFGANPNDFEAYYAPLVEPTNKIKIEGNFVDDGDDWFWTPIFFIYKPQKYIIHILNKADGINSKQVFDVVMPNDDYVDESDILI